MYKYQGFLVGAKLTYRQFIPTKAKDHEHCNMCGAKFSDNVNDLRFGYATDDDTGWVCPACFAYYKDEYEWKED